ncbi:hypothetical protein K2P97_07115 [bacterium]|nr:hypothetical protein [bacterium]
MFRRSFFKKMTAVLGVSMAAPLVLANEQKNAVKGNKNNTLYVISRPEEKGGLAEQQINIVRKLNDDFRTSGKLVKTVLKNISDKQPEKGYVSVYTFDSKQSKELYVKQKEELLANHSATAQKGLA